METEHILLHEHLAASVLLRPCCTFHCCIFRVFSHANRAVTMALLSIMCAIKKWVFCFSCSSLENIFKSAVFRSQMLSSIQSNKPALYIIKENYHISFAKLMSPLASFDYLEFFGFGNRKYVVISVLTT